jgi:hypothetical protein
MLSSLMNTDILLGPRITRRCSAKAQYTITASGCWTSTSVKCLRVFLWISSAISTESIKSLICRTTSTMKLISSSQVSAWQRIILDNLMIRLLVRLTLAKRKKQYLRTADLRTQVQVTAVEIMPKVLFLFQILSPHLRRHAISHNLIVSLPPLRLLSSYHQD